MNGAGSKRALLTFYEVDKRAVVWKGTVISSNNAPHMKYLMANLY